MCEKQRCDLDDEFRGSGATARSIRPEPALPSLCNHYFTTPQNTPQKGFPHVSSIHAYPKSRENPRKTRVIRGSSGVAGGETIGSKGGSENGG